MSIQSRRTITLLSICFLACACSDDDDGPSYNRNTPIAEISDAEAEAYCNHVKQQVDFIVNERNGLEYLCTIAGLVATNSESTCEGFVSDCISDPPDTFAEELDTFSSPTENADCPAAAADTTCEEPLGTAETCTDGRVEGLRDLIDIDCSRAAEIDATTPFEEVVTEPEEPAACVTLDEACPNALDDLLPSKPSDSTE